MRDSCRALPGYSKDTCSIMDNGQPPARCGQYFVAVHQADVRTGSETDNKLDEMYGFTLTATQRVIAPPDKIGENEIALDRWVTRKAQETGFNRRCEELRAFFHMAWGVLQMANDNLVAMTQNQGTGIVYGFCEPARYRSMTKPRFVGGEWFSGKPEAKDFGITSDLTFADMRRFQAIAEYV